jgi:hypothetical protein
MSPIRKSFFFSVAAVIVIYSKKCFVSRLDLRNYIDSDSIIATVENKKSKKRFSYFFRGRPTGFREFAN